MFHALLNALEETIFMVLSAGLLIVMMGLPLGILLAITQPRKFLDLPMVYRPLSLFITTVHKIPYVAMMIALIPLTRFLVGSAEGCAAAIVPLTLGSVPYFTRLVERAIHQVPNGLIDAAKIIGASPFQIVYKVLIPEALPHIIHALTLMLTQLIGYSMIAGILGGGGLGSLMIHNRSQTLQTQYVLATIALLITLVQLIQIAGNYIAKGNLPNHNNV